MVRWNFANARWPWLVGALLVLFTHLSTTFLTTLVQEDWQECINSASRRPHMFAVTAYWNVFASYSEHYVWSIGSALPAMFALVWLRSRIVAGVCLAMLALLLWSNLNDFGLMIGEFLRGEVVTAQRGYHDCDFKGTDNAQVMRLWLYLTALIVAAVTAAMLIGRRRSRRAELTRQKRLPRAS